VVVFQISELRVSGQKPYTEIATWPGKLKENV